MSNQETEKFEESVNEAEAEMVPTMDFYEALKEVTIGKRIQRLEWHDSEYGFMKQLTLKDGDKEVTGDFLCLHRREQDHEWIISNGDLTGEDWISF